MLGPLLRASMSKECTPLWREAHFQVKSVKTDGFRALLEVEMPLWPEAYVEVKNAKNGGGYGALLDIVQMSFCVAGDGDCAPCQK